MNKEKQGEKLPQNVFTKMEEAVLDYWDRAGTFAKSVEKEAPRGDYVFYDGPPFGTGEPHYGHILSSISKDVVPRYFTMKGYRVERRWGWDCHGLPIENIIEKDLGLSGKKQIEEYGVAKFNEACRARVLEYADIWDTMIRRIGRWVDFKNSYKTMDLTYMESVWWGFKESWNKGLVYQGRKVLLYCPRCETPISNFEVAMDNSYKDITETSVFVKFKVKDGKLADGYKIPENTFVLAWTTTPWTLPGNVALAVGEDIAYVLIAVNGEQLVLAKDRLEIISHEYEIVREIKGGELVGLEYEPLFDVPAIRESGKKAHYVASADFVTTEDGTGVVHTAVVYGEDDYNLGLKLDLPVVPALDDKGIFNDTVPQFQGVYFKKADKLVIEDLESRNLLFMRKDVLHSYPHCHRCETQLFYNAIPAWFIGIGKIREKLLEQNEKINWYPDHLKHGRFALGIGQAPDWNISRNRYFATPIPIWRCESCGELEIIGSVAELQEKSGAGEIADIHSHYIDDLTWACGHCGGKTKRIKEVFDCWVESGSMSYAQMHYPFENKEKFEHNFPAQFISEYISQTRAWFYVMHVMSTALFDSNSFENVVTTGVILNEKGEKMSKSKKNYPDPWKVINEFGVDALRMYLMGSSLMHAENLFFNERELRDVFRKNLMILWNVYSFYAMYAAELKVESSKLKVESDNILDNWVLARLNQLIAETTAGMDGYDMPRAARAITDFIDELSTWYLRRSRDRFKGKNAKDKEQALETMGFVLLQLSKLMAPFMPFMAEQLWQKVTGYDFGDDDRSVHLEEWPSELKIKNEELKILEEMAAVRKIVELGLAKRDEVKIKVRQPLAKLKVESKKLKVGPEFIELIKDEVNVKEVEFGDGDEIAVTLDTELTDELRLEGMKRELVRAINGMRKDAGLTIGDRIVIHWNGGGEVARAFETYKAEIAQETLADDIIPGVASEGKEVAVNGERVTLALGN